LKLLYGCDEGLCKWAGLVIAGNETIFSQPATAIGIISDDGQNLAGAVVYNNLRTCGIGAIEMSIATVDKRWATRHNLQALFSYPFTQLGLGRVEAHCREQDEGVAMFIKKLGFQKEGVLRCAAVDGTNAISFGMLKHECRWL
jgi:hypothetical protein